MKWPFGLFPSRRPYWKDLDFDEHEINYLDERIAWESIHTVTAGLQDCFTYDLIWIHLEYGDAGLNIWEEWPRFSEFEAMLERKIPIDKEPLSFLRTHAFSQEPLVLYKRPDSGAPTIGG